jgi:hypothetical protein
MKERGQNRFLSRIHFIQGDTKPSHKWYIPCNGGMNAHIWAVNCYSKKKESVIHNAEIMNE